MAERPRRIDFAKPMAHENVTGGTLTVFGGARTLPPAVAARRPYSLEGPLMSWKTPVIVEIAVGCEINAYACAEVV
jgi:coenzyme PQQ precursor peptide PqqA